MHPRTSRLAAVGALGVALLAPAVAAAPASAASASAAHASAAPVAPASSAIAAERSVQVDTTTYTPGNKVTITGTTTPGRTVSTAFPGDTNLDATRADATGRWSLTSIFPVTDTGSIALEITVGQFTGTPTTVRHTLTAEERFVEVDTRTYTPGATITISGTTNPHGVVSAVFPGDDLDIDATTADASGTWSLTSIYPATATGPISVEVTGGLFTADPVVSTHTLTPADSPASS